MSFDEGVRLASLLSIPVSVAAAYFAWRQRNITGRENVVLSRIARADSVSNTFVSFQIVGPIVQRREARTGRKLSHEEALMLQKKVVLMIHQINYYYHAFVMSRLFKREEIREMRAWARNVFGAWIMSDPNLYEIYRDYISHGDGFPKKFVSQWLKKIA